MPRFVCAAFSYAVSPEKWQARRESNPQPAVLETAALPIELLAFKCTPVSDGGPKISQIGYTELDIASVAASLQTSSAAQLDSLQDDKGALSLPSHFQGTEFPPHLAALLVDDSSDNAGAYRTTAFSDRKSQTVVHRNRTNQLNNHLHVITRHHHLNALG